MANVKWNTFVAKYRTPVGYISEVSAKLSGGVQFDRNKKKLPTPYGLFKEWASVKLQGDWTSQKLKGGFIICVATKQDADSISKAFGLVDGPVKTKACNQTYKIGYKNGTYGKLAKSLGYSL
ncbi:MAG: hypothetical protein P8176_13635 [Gammaproteobacteria bacterium]